MGGEAAMPLFDAGRICAAASRGPSRTCCLSCLRQDRPEASQQAPTTASGLRDTVVNVLLSNLLFAPTIVEMESAEKGPGVTLGELVMLRDKLTGRLEALGPGEVVRARGRACRQPSW